jgi:hypothetical protein
MCFQVVVHNPNASCTGKPVSPFPGQIEDPGPADRVEFFREKVAYVNYSHVKPSLPPASRSMWICRSATTIERKI